MLNKLDELLLDKVFDVIAKRFQILTGKNCYFLASVFHIITAILVTLLGFIHLTANILPPREKVFTLMLMLLVVSQELFFAHLKQEKEEKINAGFGNDTMNPARLSLSGLRRTILGMLFFVSIIYSNIFQYLHAKDYILWMAVWSQIIYVYFFSCSPLPPCAAKIKELLRNFLKAAKSQEAPI